MSLCSAWGDPHYTTYGGTSYDFMGIGTYELAKSALDSFEAQVFQCPLYHLPWAEKRFVYRFDPPWYTKEWPKDCQYNSPGCTLDDLEASGHKTDLHRNMVRDNTRWEEAKAKGVKSIRLSFMQMTDEDLAEIIGLLKGNQDVTELDLTHNQIKDQGVQALVAALAAGAAPNLRELKIYRNEFGDLGKTMLTQGLSVFRKKLDIRTEEPDWSRFARPAPVVPAVAESGAATSRGLSCGMNYGTSSSQNNFDTSTQKLCSRCSYHEHLRTKICP